jgi:hypothetical protein
VRPCVLTERGRRLFTFLHASGKTQASPLNNFVQRPMAVRRSMKELPCLCPSQVVNTNSCCLLLMGSAQKLYNKQRTRTRMHTRSHTCVHTCTLPSSGSKHAVWELTNASKLCSNGYRYLKCVYTCCGGFLRSRQRLNFVPFVILIQIQEQLRSKYVTIRGVLDSLQKYFEADSEEVQREWARFTQKVDHRFDKETDVKL